MLSLFLGLVFALSKLTKNAKKKIFIRLKNATGRWNARKLELKNTRDAWKNKEIHLHSTNISCDFFRHFFLSLKWSHVVCLCSICVSFHPVAVHIEQYSQRKDSHLDFSLVYALYGFSGLTLYYSAAYATI